jgi:hypothetical protein
MSELVFEAVQEADGGFCAECLTEDIFTQGDTWDELRKNVVEATAAFFFDQPRPERIRLHLVRDEVLSVAWKYLVTCRAIALRRLSADTGNIRGFISQAVISFWKPKNRHISALHSGSQRTSGRNVQFDSAGRIEAQWRDAWSHSRDVVGRSPVCCRFMGMISQSAYRAAVKKARLDAGSWICSNSPPAARESFAGQ